MDAIREALQPPPLRRIPTPPLLGAHLELDIRGETLVLHYEARRATARWTHTDRHRIYRSSLEGWWDSVAEEAHPMSDEEGDAVFALIVQLARAEFGAFQVEACP